jgi:hypothetical protein
MPSIPYYSQPGAALQMEESERILPVAYSTLMPKLRTLSPIVRPFPHPPECALFFLSSY